MPGRDASRFAELAGWLARIQGQDAPRPPVRPRVVIVNGNHTGDTAEQIAARVAELADLAGAGISIIQAPDDDPVPAGTAAADREVDAGADLVALVVPDIDVVAGAVACVHARTEPVKVVGRGGSLAPAEWARRVVAVRSLRRELLASAGNLHGVLATVPDPRFGFAVGFLLRAAGRRTGILLDGAGAGAAALAAQADDPEVADWCITADSGGDPVLELAAAELGAPAVLDLGLPGDGLAAASALLLLRAVAISATPG